MRVVCDLGNPAELEALLTQAGFQQIAVNMHERTATHPDVRAAVGDQLSALPSGLGIGALESGRRAELTDLMCQLLAEHVGPDGGLTVPSTGTHAHAINPQTYTEEEA